MSKPNLLDIRALESAVNVATRLEKEHESIVNGAAGEIALKRERMNATAQRLGGDKAIVEALEKQHSQEAASLLEQSKDGRWKRLGELKEMQEMAVAAREHYSPIAMATSEGIGTEERGRYLAEYSGLGPAALKRAADRVRLTGNKLEAAALISVNDKAPKADRGFKSHELADALWSEDSKRANSMIGKLEQAFANAMARNRQLEGKPLSPVESISHGLRFPNAPRVSTPSRPQRLQRDMTALRKLEAGLAAAE